jgi:hypothetical protein
MKNGNIPSHGYPYIFLDSLHDIDHCMPLQTL